MIYDLRFTICRSRREEADSFHSTRGHEAQILYEASRSSIRSEIFVARTSSKDLKPRWGGIIGQIRRRRMKDTFRDVAPTELCGTDGGHLYKYAAPDGAIRPRQHWRTV